jgi:hypothetical protein
VNNLTPRQKAIQKADSLLRQTKQFFTTKERGWKVTEDSDSRIVVAITYMGQLDGHAIFDKVKNESYYEKK